MNEFDIKKDYEFSSDSFELVQSDKKIFDQKFETKPTTFFKDAMKRFTKNKSSVVGSIILGIILLLALIVPVASTSDIDTIKRDERYLEPKLFDAGTGFWDGTKKLTDIVYDCENEVPAGYYKPACISITVDPEPTLVNQANAFGHNGFVMFANETIDNSIATLTTPSFKITKEGNYTVSYELGDIENALETNLGEYRVVLTSGSNKIVIKDWSKDYKSATWNLSNIIDSQSLTEFTGTFGFELKTEYLTNQTYTYILIKNVTLSCNETNANYEALKGISFTDATQMVLRDKTAAADYYWTCLGRKGVFESELYYCDFVFDTYANVYDASQNTYALSELEKYKKQGLCTYDISTVKYNSTTGEYDGVDEFIESFEVLDESCPIDTIISVSNFNPVTHKVSSLICGAYRYKAMGYATEPRYIMGTDATGQDLFKKCFYGLRQSFALAIGIALFNFIFGLIWGSISGYFGGYVDLFMERFCDVLGRVPDLLVISLITIYLGSGYVTFILALIMTGWMGTAGLTRTQFYRFKGREYVLASRTLGSSDTRLIFKHILPNSLGTIITSSVFMITSIIRTEASFSYLHIGLDSSNSFGVILSNNQQYINSYPYLIVFPSVVMALMMISFNLFGNGLRDAMNPSLKGSE